VTHSGWGKVFRKILRWLIPLGISGLSIWLVLRNIELSQFIENFSRVGFQTFFLASIFYFVSYFLRVFCWHTLLRGKVTYWDAFFTMGAGYLLNNTLPLRLGEIGRAVLLSDPDGLSTFEVLSSILVERIFDVLLAAVFVLSTLPRILGNGYDQTLIVIALFVSFVGLIGLILMVRFRAHLIKWLNAWGEQSDFIKRWITPKVIQVLNGLAVLNHPKYFILSFASLVLSWFVAFGENFVVFRSLYPDPPFWWMIFVLSAGAFGAALPSAPAGIGVFEGVMVAAFALLGVEAELALTHAIVIHLLAFVYANILGLIGLHLRGEALITLYQRVVNRRTEIQTVD
jgi:uncharacterized protein (TIRG00374 family)